MNINYKNSTWLLDKFIIIKMLTKIKIFDGQLRCYFNINVNDIKD